MFDIVKLCELATKKSSYYSFSYDKKEDCFVSFKAYGNLTEEEQDHCDTILSLPHRYTPPISFKANNFSMLRDLFITTNGINQEFKNKNQFVRYLESNNLFDDWITLMSSYYAFLTQKYVEANDLKETLAEATVYQSMEDEIVKFRDNYTKLNENTMYVYDETFSNNPFVFSYFLNKNYIILQFKYNTSAIASFNILKSEDEHFIDPYLLKAICTGISFKIPLDRPIYFDPYSVKNSVSFVYTSRARLFGDYLPCSAALYINSLLICLNNVFKDKKAMKRISSSKNQMYLNISKIYKEEDYYPGDNPGEKELMNALTIYNYNDKLLDTLDNTFKTKHKYNYGVQLGAISEFSPENKPLYRIFIRIKNFDTNKVTTILVNTTNTYNPLEKLGEKVLEFFEDNGRPKKMTVTTFYDYIFIATIFLDWSIKVDYDEIDFDNNSKEPEEDIEEDDNDYISA